ncbi:NAD-binding protein [Streptomyces sp. NPDC059467]|uniref:NAD-binding protein n=1 Tax=Streptomyces sp. NPDC059467 TaxID=3346844 RepID=UPI0036BBF268
MVVQRAPRRRVRRSGSRGTPCCRLRERAGVHGVDVLEAPMGGSPDDAEHGRLRLFVGGSAEVLERCRPLLEAVATSDRISHMGGPGTGCTTKLLINLLWFGQAAATAEALLLGRRAGIDLAALRDTPADSAAGSDFIRRDLPAPTPAVAHRVNGCVSKPEK